MKPIRPPKKAPSKKPIKAPSKKPIKAPSKKPIKAPHKKQITTTSIQSDSYKIRSINWPDLELTKDDLALMFGLTSNMVTRKLNARFMKPNKNGKYYFRSVVSIIENAESKGSNDTDFAIDYDNPDDLPPKERLDAIKGDLAKRDIILKDMRNNVESRQLLRADEVEKMLAKAFKSISMSIDAIPFNLERDGLLEPKAIDNVEKVIYSIRDIMARELKQL